MRFTPQFLDDVDAMFGRDRSSSLPSRADFHNEDLPLLVQVLVEDFEANTMPSDVPGERVLVRPSKFGGFLVLYVQLSDIETIDLVGLDIDAPPAATYD